MPVVTSKDGALARIGSAPRAFDYDDISLVPRRASTLTHRADALPEVAVGPARLRIPLVAAPMPDVCGWEMCEALAGLGGLGLVHRFQSVAEQVEEYRRAAAAGAVGAGIGVTGDFRERFTALVEAGCRIICLDTANGAHSQVAVAMSWAKEAAPDAFLIAVVVIVILASVGKKVNNVFSNISSGLSS